MSAKARIERLDELTRAVQMRRVETRKRVEKKEREKRETEGVAA